MDDKADVAIVGGGVIGLACAYELKRAGVDRVVVLEAENTFGAGSSSRANGGIRAQFSTPINIAFSLFTIGELERLSSDNDDLTFHQAGYMFFTGDPQEAAGLGAAVELQRSLGVDTEWLTPEQVASKAPVVDTRGLVAATFNARDGFIDPWSVVVAYRDLARSAGAELRSDARVDSIEREPAGFTLSIGDEGLFAGLVVDAAGAAAADVAGMLGVDLPIYPVRRNLAFLEDGSYGLIPMCVDLDSGVLVRREPSGGYVVAYSDPADEPGWDTSVDPKFLDDVAARIGGRFPSLQSLTVDPKHCWAGLYPETPDHHAVIGALPGVPGAFVCGGFGGHGLMHSAAGAKAIAEVVTTGRCETFDLHPLRPERFAEDDLVTETTVF